MRELLEGRVVVGGQHLRVGVDVHAGAFGLLQELLHVLEIVARDQDAGIVPDPQGNARDFGLPVGGRVGPVDEGHGDDGHTPGLQRQLQELGDLQIPGGGGQRLHDERRQLRVVVAQDHGVVLVGCDALQAVDHGLAQGAGVLVGVAEQHPHLVGLLAQGRLASGLPAGHGGVETGQERRMLLEEVRLDGEALADQLQHARGVEVGVGHGGEQGQGEETGRARLRCDPP